MQAKGIPDEPILKFLLSIDGEWGNWTYDTHAEWYRKSVVQAFPEGTPPKLLLAKMRSMMKRGLVDGCPCGCRGDSHLTEKGRELAKQ